MKFATSTLIGLVCIVAATTVSMAQPSPQSRMRTTVSPPAVWYVRFAQGQTNVPVHLQAMVAGAPSRKWGPGPFASVLCYYPTDQADRRLGKDRLTAVERLLRASGADAVYIGSRALCEHSGRPHAPQETLEIHRLMPALAAPKEKGAGHWPAPSRVSRERLSL